MVFASSARPNECCNPRIGGERRAIKGETQLWRFANGLCAVCAQTNAPSLQLDRLRVRKSPASEQRDVHATVRVARGAVANDFDRCGPRRVGESLAGPIVRWVRPGRAVPPETASRKVDRSLGPVFGGEYGVFGGIRRPRRLRRFSKKQQAMEGYLSNGRFGLLGGVEHALGQPRPPKPRSGGIGRAVSERRR